MALGDTIAGIGRFLNLPEMNISEKFGGAPTPSLNDPNASQNFQNIQSGQPTNYGPYLPSATNPQPSTGSAQYGPFLPTGGGSNPQPTNNNNNNGQQNGPSAGDLFNEAKNYYNNAYGDLLSGLDPQRSAQENIVNNNFGQSISDLGATKTQGLADLATQTRKTQEGTQKTLNDLTENIRNQTTAGQVYLGARGAGDSSAANQYAYALTKMGNQNRGNVLSQQNSILADIGDREAKLTNIFTQESSRLETEKNNGLQQIAQWYADAQNQIKQARTQDVGALSMQALQFAIQGIQNVQGQIAQRKQALESWALDNSKTIQEAKSKLSGAADFMAPAIQGQSLNGTPLFGGGGSSAGPAVGYGSTQTKDIFGNLMQ